MFENITRENFNQLIQRFSVSELENLIDKYPYFNQAHILLAKKYQEENNAKFDEQLQLAVLYAHDREFLYDLFNSEAPLTTKKEEVSLPTLSSETLSEDMPFSRSVTELGSYVEQREELITVEPGAQVNADRIKTETPLVIEQVLPDEQPLEEPIVVFELSRPHTFAEWLKAYSSSDIIKRQKPIDKTDNYESKMDEELELLYLTNLPLQELVEEETHYSKGLDRFIKEQKQKHKPRKDKISANENELVPEMVTETIAIIFEAQKKYARAIQAYEALSLKYPEKSDLFAARISELKNSL